ncbi:hypothetical protein F5876DRAFT_80644 [Lentinula aff. lateritia]|uniref:Uncharacterized protein n=1 Tax=Lentinula aff. lateritia TaxID=2804960 RepID=A0ACC1TPF5_9AGAR|nr:hypothetical protein F5876DRAFT_80644 [Lentinula aff. lateritia]
MAQNLSQPPVEIFGIWLSENDRSIFSVEIDRLARITPILEERAKKLPKYNFLVNLVSPIDQLPRESLSQIFTQALFAEDRPRDHVLALCRVCRVSVAWRNTAITTPQTWTRIYFDIDLSATRITSEGVKEWISRSRALPLEVHLDLYPEYDDNTTLRDRITW